MVRIRCTAVICQMAGRAIRRKTRVHVVFVTRRALHRQMGTGQRKFGGDAMIETGIRPPDSGMTGQAVPGKSRSRMIRIRRCRVILRMAVDARGGRSGKFPVHMAGGAIELCMPAGERKTGIGTMVKGDSNPGIHADVTGSAGRGKRRCLMVWRLGSRIVAKMARDTIGA
jgi:hypothetical protein